MDETTLPGVPPDLTPEEFLIGCRMHAHWFVPFVLDVQNSQLHDDLQWWLDETDDGYAELPRNHGKSNQIIGRLAFEIGRNPNIRIKSVGSNTEEAAKNVTAVRTILESERFKMVFPEIEPDPDNWGKESLTVKRTKTLRDATLSAMPIIGGRAGGRADILLADDICDPKNAIQQPAMRDQVKDAWATLFIPMLDAATPGYRTWKIGTPYHVDDITASWREYHGRSGTLFRRPCIGTRSSPWPEVFTPEELTRKFDAMGPLAYARAFELRPLSGSEVLFQTEWVDRAMYRGPLPEYVIKNGQRIGAVDCAFTERTAKKAEPDWSVFVVGIRDPMGNLYIERVWRTRTTFPDFKNLVAREARLARVQTIWTESQGPLAGIASELRAACPCSVVGLPRSVDKYSRACEAQEFVMNGKLRFRADGISVCNEHQVAYDELTTFPVGKNDDCVDAIVDMIVEGCKRATWARNSMPEVVSSSKKGLWRIGMGR